MHCHFKTRFMPRLGREEGAPTWVEVRKTRVERDKILNSYPIHMKFAKLLSDINLNFSFISTGTVAPPVTVLVLGGARARLSLPILPYPSYI